MIPVRWTSVGAGRVALSHRPRLKDIPLLASQGCQRIVTIQGPKEAPAQIERTALEAGLSWTWVPVGNGKFLEDEADRLMRQGLRELVAAVEAGESVLVHCSAGIHRTGMLVFALLRWLGMSHDEALDRLAEMRPETRDGVRDEHLAWGDRIAADAGRG